jgi:hypothetical protein
MIKFGKRQIYDNIIEEVDTDHVLACATTALSCGYDIFAVFVAENNMAIFTALKNSYKYY